MPRIFHCQFPIRYYECDPYGHLNNAHYLRYATEAALGASADAGYADEQYRALGTTWWIREAGIEYLRPAKYGETLAVKTWVSDFRRVRSRREYEMTVAGSGESVARAWTDWVYLSTETGEPVRIPDELVRAFFPKGTPPQAPKRDPFPEAPPAPPGAFTARRRVGWHHLDMVGHMNSAWYLSLLEDVAIDAAEFAGWPMERATETGFGILAREHRIEYLRPAQLGDSLDITTYIGEFRRASATRHYRMKFSGGAQVGESAARARTRWVWVDLRTGRPMAIPEDVLRDFADQVADADDKEAEQADR
jgi:acyl-CoA thioester hydrolase